MERPPTHGHPPALVIGGMHRSGTSLTASIIASAGIHLGDDLMAPAASNPRGHFEDLEFYNLHQRILAASGLSMEGYTCQEVIDVPASARTEAIDLVRRRRAANRPWGWKDPRTILFLDFWADLVPEARWLFVVRPPEEVIDSLFRRGDTAFVVNPRHAVDVWVAYARRIIEFVRRHPDRSAVVDLARVIADPAGIVRLASDLVGTGLANPQMTYEPGLLMTGHASHRAGLVRAARPELHDLHADLMRTAGGGIDALDSAAPSRLSDVADAALAEWVGGCRKVVELGGLAAHGAKAQAALEQTARELEAERAARTEAAAHAEELASTVASLANDMAKERVARAAVDHHLAASDAERDRLRTELAAATARATESERVWTHCLDEARAERDETVTRLEADIAAARSEADAAATERDRLRQQLESERMAFLAEIDAERTAFQTERSRLVTHYESKHDGLVAAFEAERSRLLADHQAERTRLLADHETERDEIAARLEAEQEGLIAQLEAERMIHESLRMDMTGRIEAAVAGQGRSILG